MKAPFEFPFLSVVLFSVVSNRLHPFRSDDCPGSQTRDISRQVDVEFRFRVLSIQPFCVSVISIDVPYYQGTNTFERQGLDLWSNSLNSMLPYCHVSENVPVVSDRIIFSIVVFHQISTKSRRWFATHDVSPNILPWLVNIPYRVSWW